MITVICVGHLKNFCNICRVKPVETGIKPTTPKDETNVTINHIMEMECLSYDKARDIYNLLTDDVKKEIDWVYATKDANAKLK